MLLPQDRPLSCQCRSLLWVMHPRDVHLNILVLALPIVELCSNLPCQIPHVLVAPGADIVPSALQPAACMLLGLSRSVGSNTLQAWLQWRDEVQLKLHIFPNASRMQPLHSCSYAHVSDKAMLLAWAREAPHLWSELLAAAGCTSTMAVCTKPMSILSPTCSAGSHARPPSPM